MPALSTRHIEPLLATSDTTAPNVTNFSFSRYRISQQAGANDFDATITADEEFVEYQIEKVADVADARGSGTLIESGVIAATTSHIATITSAELDTAGITEGTHQLKVWVKDAAENWSTTATGASVEGFSYDLTDPVIQTLALDGGAATTVDDTVSVDVDLASESGTDFELKVYGDVSTDPFAGHPWIQPAEIDADWHDYAYTVIVPGPGPINYAPFNVKLSSGLGAKTIRVKARDGTLNESVEVTAEIERVLPPPAELKLKESGAFRS